MQSTDVVGVDIGGTKIHTGRIIDSVLTTETKIPTPSGESERIVVDSIISAIESVFDSRCQGIGIGVPSIVDIERGIVHDVQAIASWKKVFLKDILENHFRTKVLVNNDSNCFALGEKLFGKGRAFNHFVGITLGTGLGTGIIVNNTLYCGSNCGAGEIGMFPYKDGILEDYCAKHFFMNNYNTEGALVYQKAVHGDADAIDILHELGKNLSYAVRMIMYAFDPEAILFGGSISDSFPFFIDSLRENLRDFPYQNSYARIVLQKSELENAALLGAGALLYDNPSLSAEKPAVQ
jgi:glucokinase